MADQHPLMPVRLTVNARALEFEVSPDLSLLRFLRDTLHLTGPKDGCSEGHCGACTVIVNGKAQRACLLRMKKLDGAVIETIEGLAQDGRLHPLQEAFIAHGAVQCGYCTPGMIMAAKALLDRTPLPTEQEIRSALTRNHNVCRCTGYNRIIEAIQDAAAHLAAGQPYPPAAETTNATVLRRDAVGRVTGSTLFADDHMIPGMLHGKIRWADHPHAEILSIDTSAAERMPGVVAVLTAADVPGLNVVGLIRPDQFALADRKVRFIGDPVACVLAESPEAAAAGRDAINVSYRVLPGVFSPEEAAQPGAALVHASGNLIHQAHLERGNAAEAFAHCAAVVEHTYTTPAIEHAYLEPESGLGFPDPDGGVTVEIGTQAAFDDRRQLAVVLGLPPEKVRVVQLPIGGAFGAKEELLLHQFLALGALKTGRPVKITLTRQESLRTHAKRHPARMHFRIGADAQGRLLALEGHIVLDGGAYTSMSINALETGLGNAAPYFVPNFYLHSEVWYTNNITNGAMRGFGVNQVNFAVESSLDELARRLGIDPFEFRLRNALDVGVPTIVDHVMEPGLVSLKETIRAARDELQRTPIPPAQGAKRIGVGMACGQKTIGVGRGYPESAGARIELDAAGFCRVLASQHDMGQGAYAGLLELTARELDLPLDRIAMAVPATGVTPETGTTTASRQTFLSGNAVVAAARDLRGQLANRAADELDAAPQDIRIEGAHLVDSRSGRRLPLSALGDRFVAERRYHAPATLALPTDGPSAYDTPGFRSRPTHWCYAFCTHVAVVEVDTTTGAVQVLKVIAAHDVGHALNPAAVRGQIEGGVVMGLGYALSEEFVSAEGIPVTDSLQRCKLPTAEQAPEIVSLILEVPHPEGPYGVKGLAEAPTIPITPAILNAIRDAVGVRITSLPANPAKVAAALQAGTGP